MAGEERRVRTAEGLLTWDGRVLEYFKTDGRSGAWRVHAATILKWELDQRKNVTLLKVYDNERHYESALIADHDVQTLRAILAEVDAVT
jgi:hypothetical protein